MAPSSSQPPDDGSKCSAQRRLAEVALTLPIRQLQITSLIQTASQHLSDTLPHSKDNESWIRKLDSNEVHFQPFRYNTSSGLMALDFFGRKDLLERGIITKINPPTIISVTPLQVAKRIMAKLMAEDDPTFFAQVLALPLEPLSSAPLSTQSDGEENGSAVNMLTSLWESSKDDAPETVSKTGTIKPKRKRTPQCFGQFQWATSSTTSLQCEAIRKMWPTITDVSKRLVANYRKNGPMSAMSASKLLQSVRNVGELLGFVIALDLAATGLVNAPTKAELVDVYCKRIFSDASQEQLPRVQWNSTLLVVAQISGLQATQDYNKIDGTKKDIKDKIGGGVETMRGLIARALGKEDIDIGWELVEHAICKTGRWNAEKGGTPKFYTAPSVRQVVKRKGEDSQAGKRIRGNERQGKQ